MSHVIAFLDQETCRIYPTREMAPEGATVFESHKELATAVPTRTLDTIRERILGITGDRSPSAEAAAYKLWHVLTLFNSVREIDYKKIYTLDGFGNRKYNSTARIELIQLTYVPGADPLFDVFYKKLKGQAKQVLNMLIDDGRKIWTNEQANEIIARRADEIKTSQGALYVFNYYKSHLFQKKILRRVSYAEFASRPEFAAMALQDKE